MVSGQELEILGKIALAGLLGFIVGWEREAHGHAAGVRTLALIALGAAAFTALAIASFPVADRVVANIVTGVGFLGAGMILHGSMNKVRGLTTAASVWTMTSISVAVGTGHYVVALGMTGLVLLLLWWQYIPGLVNLLPKTTQQRMAQNTKALQENRPQDAPPIE